MQTLSAWLFCNYWAPLLPPHQSLVYCHQPDGWFSSSLVVGCFRRLVACIAKSHAVQPSHEIALTLDGHLLALLAPPMRYKTEWQISGRFRTAFLTSCLQKISPQALFHEFSSHAEIAEEMLCRFRCEGQCCSAARGLRMKNTCKVVTCDSERPRPHHRANQLSAWAFSDECGETAGRPSLGFWCEFPLFRARRSFE